MAGTRILEVALWRRGKRNGTNWRRWTVVRCVLEMLIRARRAVARSERLTGAFCFAGFWLRLVRAALDEGAARNSSRYSWRGDACCCWRHQTWASRGGDSRLRCLDDLGSSGLNHSA